METVAMRRLRASARAWEMLIAVTAPVAVQAAKFATVLPAARAP
jgi:hypothetical protein